MADYGAGAGSLTGGTKTTSSLGTIAELAIPLLLSLFGSKKASPQAAAQTTGQQNAATLANLPPEIKQLLAIQTQNAQAAQPLYLNALVAQNRLLPSWARGGSTGMTPTTGTTTPTVPYTPGISPNINAGAGDAGMPKTPALSNDNSPFSGVGVDNGLVPGNSLDPQVVMTILGLLTGNPMFGGLSKFVQKPQQSNSTFTLT